MMTKKRSSEFWARSECRVNPGYTCFKANRLLLLVDMLISDIQLHILVRLMTELDFYFHVSVGLLVVQLVLGIPVLSRLSK